MDTKSVSAYAYKKWKIFSEDFNNYFGVNATCCDKIYLIPAVNNCVRKEHLLYMLFYFKQRDYHSFEKAADFFGERADSFRRWVWATLDRLYQNLPNLNLENRFYCWTVYKPSMVLVKGPTVPITNPNLPFNTSEYNNRAHQMEYCSDEIDGPGLKYMVGVHMKDRQIVGVFGPNKGHMTDNEIVQSTVLPQLHQSEIVIGTDCAWQAPPFFDREMDLCLEDKPVHTSLEHQQQRIEYVGHRLNSWAILTEKWKGSHEQHKKIFNVICRILNISFEDDPKLCWSNVDADNLEEDAPFISELPFAN